VRLQQVGSESGDLAPLNGLCRFRFRQPVFARPRSVGGDVDDGLPGYSSRSEKNQKENSFLFSGAAVLLNQVVQVLAGPNLDSAPWLPISWSLATARCEAA
jgi:hypothetical protein